MEPTIRLEQNRDVLLSDITRMIRSKQDGMYRIYSAYAVGEKYVMNYVWKA
jgi:hypothetical protein